MTLSAAITDLKDYIRIEGFEDGLIEEIAGDWDINPTLLLRKFTEQTGKHPRDMVIRDMTETLRARAMDKAAELFSTEYTGAGRHTGKLFDYNNEEHCIVAVCGSKIHCLMVKTGERFTISFSNSISASKYANKI